MKTYVKPVLTDVSLGKVTIDGETHEVVGIIPFLAAAAAAAVAVGKAVEAYDDKYTEYQYIDAIEEVE